MTFETHKKHKVQMPDGAITPHGIASLTRMFEYVDMDQQEWRALNPNIPFAYLPPLPSDWQWVWKTDSGTYRGKFTKRVQQYYHKAHGIRMPESFLEVVGNEARAHATDGLEYIFDFDDEFDWQDGDFGDGGSCYWSDYAGARLMLRNNGAYAIRFFDEAGEGYARAWVVPIDDGKYIVFNGYGLQPDSTLAITQILANWLGLGYRRIDIRAPHMLYINGNRGYVIGHPDATQDFWRHYINWETVHECYDCGVEILDTEAYHGTDDYVYCGDCFYERFAICDNCGETDYAEDMYSTENLDGLLCEYCYERQEAQKPDND